MRSINRYLGEPDDAAGGTDAGAVTGAEGVAGLRVTSSRPVGAVWLLDGLWRQLEVDLLFFDTTSTYFERDPEDPSDYGADGDGDGDAGVDADGDEAAGRAAGSGRYGHSKNVSGKLM